MKKIFYKLKKIAYELLIVKKYERKIKKNLPKALALFLPMCEKYKFHLAFGMVLKWHRDKTLFHNDIDFVSLPNFKTNEFLEEISKSKIIKLKALSKVDDKITAITLDAYGCPVGISIGFKKNEKQDSIISLYPQGDVEIKKYKKNGIYILEGYSPVQYTYDKFEMGKITSFDGMSFIPPKHVIRHLEQGYSTSWKIPIKSSEETPFKVGPKQAKIEVLKNKTIVEIHRRW